MEICWQHKFVPPIYRQVSATDNLSFSLIIEVPTILTSFEMVLDVLGDVLAEKTVCMSARQGDGAYRHYDVHSLYGWSQSKITQP